MTRVRLFGAFLLCIVLLAACGGEKDNDSAIKLPQQVSHFDGVVTFSLPDGWISEDLQGNPYRAFVIANTPELMGNPQYLSNVASGAFAYAYDATININDLNLAVKENIAIGTAMVMPLTGSDADMSPAELLKFFYEQAAADVSDDELAAVNRAWFDVGDSTIKTFKNGAFARFKTAGGLSGVIGAVRAGENVVVLFLATDKPDSYLSTFEAVVRSVKVSEKPIPTPTDEPTATATPTAAVTIVVVTATPVPDTATPISTPLSVVPIAPVTIAAQTPADMPATPFSTTTPQPTPSATPSCIYIVRPSDTVFSIAEVLGVSTNDLMDANPAIGEGNFRPGQQLIIPGCAQ